MKKFWIQLTLLVLVIFGGFYVSFNPTSLGSVTPFTGAQPVAQQVKINETVINVEVADTQALRTQGLSGRDQLDADSGMLFIFDSPKQYQFWMKGMKFPLDFIFINSGKVVDILRNVPVQPAGTPDSNLPVYEPVVPVDMMLEVNANFADSHGIKVGDSVFRINQ